MPKTPLSYKESGVDIDNADATKRAMAKSMKTDDKRILNSVGAFASLVDGSFPGYEHPVLVLKTEEPGTKQKLALQHGRVESICEDMINHLINDIAVMGASPVSVQDAIICGKMEKEVVMRMVAAIAAACKAQGCSLTGGETSEQPGVIEAGTYILTSSVVGVVEKSKIIDGSAIEEGDVVIAIASNGLHTNGYSLARRLLQENPELAGKKVGSHTFLDAILLPHVCYFQALKELFDDRDVHGLAHITGGGIEGNLNRILPSTMDAIIDADQIKILPVFRTIKEEGSVPDDDMRRTYNLGVGLTVVAAPDAAERIIAHLQKHKHDAYVIGAIAQGSGNVAYRGQLRWE